MVNQLMADNKPQRKDIPGPRAEEVKITHAGGGCPKPDDDPMPAPTTEEKPE